MFSSKQLHSRTRSKTNLKLNYDMDKFQKFFSESIRAQPNFDINKMGKPTDKPSKPNKPTRQRNLLAI